MYPIIEHFVVFRWWLARLSRIRTEVPSHLGRPRLFQAFLHSRAGALAPVASVVVLLMLMFGGLLIDVSNLLLNSVRLQRAADIASFAAANTPSPIVNGLPSDTARATGRQIAALNGYPSQDVTISAGVSPKDRAINTISVKISHVVPLYFHNFLRAASSKLLSGSSYASVSDTPTGDCLTSLVAPLNIYDSATVSGPSCFADAQNYLYVCGTANVSLASVTVGYTAAAQTPLICPSAQVSPAVSAFTFDTPAKDQLDGTPSIAAIKSHLSSMGAPGWPYGAQSPVRLIWPRTPTGADKTVSGSITTIAKSPPIGSLTVSNATINFSGSGGADPTCANPTTISGNVSLDGSNRLVFQSGCFVVGGQIRAKLGSFNIFSIASGANVTFVFKGGVYASAASKTQFASGHYYIIGDLNNSRGGNVIFDTGTFIFGSGIYNGPGSLSFAGGSYYLNGGSISNGSGVLTFGSGPFYLWGGSLTNATTGSVIFGDGPFYFYGGSVVNVSGTMRFGAGPFQFQGGSVTAGAGSTTSFGVGDFNFYGGSFTVSGAVMTIGASSSASNGSGTMWFYGGSMTANGGTLNLYGETVAMWGGTMYFDGPGNVYAVSPTAAAPGAGYQNILFVVYGGAFNFNHLSNQQDTLSGTIYVKSGAAYIYGNQQVQIAPGGCLSLIAGTISIFQKAGINLAPCDVSANSVAYTAHLLQ